MDVRWGELKAEAAALATDVGVSGRDLHALARAGPLLDAVRAQGVPPEHREWVWPILLHGHKQSLLRRQPSQGATYSQLLDGVADDGDAAQHERERSGLHQAHEMAMERFRHLNPFQERKIKRILLAYMKTKDDAFYYCHGMVEICAVLSTFLREEDAFWTFRVLLEALLPKYYNEASIVAFQSDCLVLQELLERQDPALAAHLAATGVTIQVLCTKWFFSFFAESMPWELVCRLYDTLLIDMCSRRRGAAKILFSTATAVFLYLSEMLLEMFDPSVIVEVLCEFCWTTLSEYSVAESFLDLTLFLHERITDDDVVGLRLKYRTQLEREERERQRHPSRVREREEQANGSDIRRRRTSRSTSSASAGAASPRTSRTHSKSKSKSIKLIIQWKQKSDGDSGDGGVKQDTEQVNDTSAESGKGRELGANDSDTDTIRTTRSTSNSSASLALPPRLVRPQADDEADPDDDVQLEIVATPTERQVLAKLHRGIDKINRRRSRTSSLRSLNLLTHNGGRRSLSLSGSVLSTISHEDEEGNIVLDNDYGIGDITADYSWESLRETGEAATIVRRSLHGVPDEHRSWVWPLLLQQAPLASTFPTSFFSASDGDTNGSIDNDEENALEPEVIKAIENDISRTRNLKEHEYPRMRRVLREFARRNRRVGYCQGMNEILGVLLQYLDERHALIGLSLLIENVLPSYHVDSMIGLHTDCAVLNTLLRQNDPELHAHIQLMGLNMEILCTKWLVTCFLTSLPQYCGLRVMDMLLARGVSERRKSGSRVLLGVGMAIFFTLRVPLLAAKDAGEILMAINEYCAQDLMTKTESEMELFLTFCQHVIDQLQPDVVEQFRLVHRDEVMERFATFEAKKIEMRQQLEQTRVAQNQANAANLSLGHRQSTAVLPKGEGVKSAGKSGTASPPRSDGGVPRSGGKRPSMSLSSYISKPLLGVSSRDDRNGDRTDNPRDLRYQRLDVVDANRSFSEELSKMEEQLDDLADLFDRGKIDDKEHACIKAQIVRKWCKGVNSPQSAMLRVQNVKAAFAPLNGGDENTTPPVVKMNRYGTSNSPGAASVGRGRSKSAVSLYGRMKNAKKTAFAMFKSTFE